MKVEYFKKKFSTFKESSVVLKKVQEFSRKSNTFI